MGKKSNIALFLLPMIFFFMVSCKQKKICAAYNSYFVFDDSNMGNYFTPFGNDSVPGEKTMGRFDDRGLVTKPFRRKDKDLEKYSTKEIKEAGKITNDSLSTDATDSMGAIISVKELFPEKVNTDQEAYEHYVGELLKKYEKDKTGGGTSAPDSSSYYNRSTKGMTKEEKATFKAEKKARKQREKEERRKAKEDANKEPEEEEFDFDLDELDN